MSRYYLINNHEYLCGPLSEKEIRDNMNKNNIIEGVVKVHLSNLIDNDLENFLDLISVGLTGSDLLMDISYDILDVSKEEKNMLYILVSGDASLIVGDTQVTDPLLDTSQMLTLSLEHITKETVKILKDEPSTNFLSLSVYKKDSFGFFIDLNKRTILNEIESEPDFPDDLKQAILFAAKMGCKTLCLDWDGPVVRWLNRY